MAVKAKAVTRSTDTSIDRPRRRSTLTSGDSAKVISMAIASGRNTS